MYTLARHVSI